MVEQAIFYAPTLELPGGTGKVDSFVRIQGAGSGTESGYNTDAYSSAGDVESEFDTKVGEFTNSLLISDIKTENFITIDGNNYFEFFLDINQTTAKPLINLTGLKLFTTSDPNLQSDLTDTSSPVDPDYPFYETATKIWDMDTTTNTTIKLDYSNYAGSGNPDLVALFPIDSLLQAPPTDTYLVLYNEFTDFNSGFEEWARKDPGTFTNDYCIAYPEDSICENVVITIAEPSILSLLVVGMVGIGYQRLRV